MTRSVAVAGDYTVTCGWDAASNPATQWSRDGLGRALTVTENSVSRDRVFDGTALIVDGDTRVAHAPDGQVLSEAFETLEGRGKNAHTTTVNRDVLTDVLGSAVGVAQDGVVNADLTWFGDFGDTLSTPGCYTVTSFTGHVETAGLVEFATRTYDPVSRVWVQEDSFTGTVTRASSLNRYAYVEGSPASHTDVLGAYRAAAAMAAQQLSAVEYAAFMQWFALLSVVGRYNEWQTNLAILRQASADEEYYHAVAGMPMPGEEYQDRGFWGNRWAAVKGWAGRARDTGVAAFDVALVVVDGPNGWARYTGSTERVDHMYESFMSGVEENGWWAQSNIAFNPVYHLIDAGDSVTRACGSGDWSRCGSSTFDFQMATIEVATVAYGGAKTISIKLPGGKPPVVLTTEAVTTEIAADSARAGVWSLPPEGGGLSINGRWYTEHALERMAPNTPEVMAQLESRAITRAKAEGLAPGTPEFGDWWAKTGPDPRGIPPMVVESEIANPGTTGLRVITNANGDIVTVWPTE